jgi:hypothetical protein
MEAVRNSETSQHRNIPEASHLHTRRRKILKFHQSISRLILRYVACGYRWLSSGLLTMCSILAVCQQTTRRKHLGDNHQHSHRCEILKSYIAHAVDSVVK